MKTFISLFLTSIYFLINAQDLNTTQKDLNTSSTTIVSLDVNSSKKSNTSLDEDTYLDDFHRRASHHVKHWSGFADDKLVDMADYLDNKEVNITQEKDSIVTDNKNAVDSFFLNDKYLDETEQSYISIRPDSRFSSKEDEDFNLKISAHLALSKSKKRFKLFINELDQDNANNVLTEEGDDEKSAPEIGLNYFAPDTHGIQSKYSVGVRGIYPFVRARFSKEFKPGEWIIEPIQTLKYSVKDEFEESTQVFCDTKLSNLSLFRFFFSRETKSHILGMAYSSSISVFWTPTKGTGLSLSQYINGSTKYQHTQDIDADPVVYEDYNGIYNYGTSASIRQNFYRKWLFYEVQPGINFHKVYGYEANYTLRVYLDIFVGNI